MAESTLVLDGLMGLVSGGALAYTGNALAKRQPEGHARVAALAFAAWWYCDALIIGAFGVLRILAGLDLLTAPMLVTAVYAILLPIVAGLACLVDYLAFVATGSRRIHVWVAAAYAALYVLLVGYVTVLEPTGFTTTPWSIRILYASPPAGWPFAAFLAVLFGPPVVAIGAYLRLYRHAETAEQRYRLALVSTSVCVLFASGIVSPEIGVPALRPLYPASHFITLAGALGIVLAYAPPQWFRRAFLAESPQDA